MTTKKFDPTLKALVDIEPKAWPEFLRRPVGPTAVIDADIATISGAADKVLHVRAATPYLLHLEFAAGHDAVALRQKLIVRNAALGNRHNAPVLSVVILLRPEADSPQLNGVVQLRFQNEEPYLIFRYQVVRVWQLEPSDLLESGFPLIALAPISNVTESDLPFAPGK